MHNLAAKHPLWLIQLSFMANIKIMASRQWCMQRTPTKVALWLPHMLFLEGRPHFVWKAQCLLVFWENHYGRAPFGSRTSTSADPAAFHGPHFVWKAQCLLQCWENYNKPLSYMYRSNFTKIRPTDYYLYAIISFTVFNMKDMRNIDSGACMKCG